MPALLRSDEWTRRFLRRLEDLLPYVPVISAEWAVLAYGSVPQPAPETAAELYAREYRAQG